MRRRCRRRFTRRLNCRIVQRQFTDRQNRLHRRCTAHSRKRFMSRRNRHQDPLRLELTAPPNSGIAYRSGCHVFRAAINVTSFLTISCLSNSEHWSH